MALTALLRPLSADQPTLARLSFWVSPEFTADFETAFDQQLLPILKDHGLKPSAARSRVTAPGVVGRLFELQTAAEITTRREAFEDDPAWAVALADLDVTFGADSPLQYRLEPYQVPAGPGVRTPSKRGLGYWRTYDVSDGLAANFVWPMIQDRDGNIWIGTSGGGLKQRGSVRNCGGGCRGQCWEYTIRHNLPSGG